MNATERYMADLLVEMKEKYHVTGVKAEFEAEGTRMEEAMRLKEVSMQAGLGLNMKIGGCEALKDMFDCISLGCERIIAPMVESPFALQKYLHAVALAYAQQQGHNVEFFINVETVTTLQNLDAMLAIAEIDQLDGIVLGRVDMTGSLGMNREDINSQRILDLALAAAAKAKAKGLGVVVGGGVSAHSLPFFRSFPAGHLDRFETRKIVFACPGALANTEAAFLKAVEFELLWLKNKRDYYSTIAQEDAQRIAMLEARYRKQIEMISGGKK